MDIKEYKDVDEFMTQYDELEKSGNKFVCFFTCGVDESTGKGWCPDCVDAQDLITTKILEKTPHPILKAVVEDKTTWCGVSDHTFKKHSVIAAKGIPTVVLC